MTSIRLAERARVLADNGARIHADLLREKLEQRNCCTECGSKLIFNEDYYQQHGYSMCPVCDGPSH